jgi:glycosyltransferase involved in cell wall biosynthesis
MQPYTLGLFANMYPAFEGDYRGIFIQQMVRDLEASGVTVKKAVKTSPSVTGYFPFYWQSLSLVRNHELDLLQAEYVPHSSVIPALLKKKGTPLVLKFHGDDARIFPFNNRLNHLVTCSMLRQADYVITASEEIRQILIGLDVKPNRISAIHTGVDTDFFRPIQKEECRRMLNLPAEADIFVFIGRLHAWKGIQELLAVALKCPTITFAFIGPGEIPEHPDNCLFAGVKPPGEVRTWLNAADCFILPTYTDAVPAAVMEAFACGIPAITTDIGGCPEIVEQEKSGLLVPVRDAERLREAVVWMSNHPEDRVYMGKNARDTAVNRYDHRILTGRLIEVHKALIR